ncbi:MAG: type II toxin-antitoxin system VapC family toxin [Ignavibacteriales bacterium]
MADLILVDTDILIDVGKGINQAVTTLDRMEDETVLGISVITQMELIIGCRNKSELRVVEKFLHRFSIIRLNEAKSEKGVDLLTHYRLSHGLLIADALIAATALTIRAPLLTKNQRHYQFIKELQLIPYP